MRDRCFQLRRSVKGACRRVNNTELNNLVCAKFIYSVNNEFRFTWKILFARRERTKRSLKHNEN